MRNKKGEEILFFWLVFIWIVIGVGIVGGVYVFYSAEINTKSLESDILNSRIIDCVVKSGESDSSLIGEEIFNLCVLDEKIKNSGAYYLEIKTYSFETCNIKEFEKCKLIKEAFFGNKKIKEECEMTSDARAESYPACSWKIIPVNEGKKEILLYVYSGSNYDGGEDDE